MNRIDWKDIVSDKELTDMYKIHSLRDMDKILGVSYRTIGRKLRKLGVQMRSCGGRRK